MICEKFEKVIINECVQGKKIFKVVLKIFLQTKFFETKRPYKKKMRILFTLRIKWREISMPIQLMFD